VARGRLAPSTSSPSSAYRALAPAPGSSTPGNLRESGTSFEFSLCLSRACLGKIMHFIYKWRKKCRFLTVVRMSLPAVSFALHKTPFPLNFSDVCFEPALVKRSLLVSNGAKEGVLRTAARYSAMMLLRRSGCSADRSWISRISSITLNRQGLAEGQGAGPGGLSHWPSCCARVRFGQL
jgi:hypothetical protein